MPLQVRWRSIIATFPSGAPYSASAACAESGEPADRPWTRLVRLASIVAAAGFAILSGFSFLGAWHWAFELLSHFRVQLLLLSAFGLLIFLTRRQWRLGMIVGALGLAHLLPIAAHMDAAASATMPAGPGLARINAFYLNMHHRTADHDAFLTYIGKTDPDVIVLTEVDPTRQDMLFSVLGRNYPNRLVTGGTGPFDMAVFSKHPLRPRGVRGGRKPGWPMVRADICPQGFARCAGLIAVHAPRPGPRWTPVRDRVFAEVAALAERTTKPLVVVGDFNSTTWSPAFQRMLRRGSLRDGGAVLAAFTPTWISRTAPFGLRIDHILTGRGMLERRREIGPAFGSDHFSVRVWLVADLGSLAPSTPAP